MDERRAYAAVTGKLLLKLRSVHNLNQEQLAARAQLSQSALSRFENGQSLPDTYELRNLATALGHPPDQLVVKIERAFAQTRDAAKKVSPGVGLNDLAAGVLAGLAILGVAAIIEDVTSKKKRS